MSPEKCSYYPPQAFPPSLDPCFAHPPPAAVSSSLPPFPSPHCLPISLPKSHCDFPIDPSLLLPPLCSLEHPPPAGQPSSAPKRLRLPSSASPSAHTKHPNEAARRRRQRFGEKTRSLQKLLPWTKKMDTATVLEEAGKYVRFLQTQVAVLQAMPISSSFGQLGIDGSGIGPLGMLNRQQVLQVLLNSPVAQTVLSELGLCVFSYEQLVMLRKAADLPTSFTDFKG